MGWSCLSTAASRQSESADLGECMTAISGQSLPIFIQVVWNFLISARILMRRMESLRRRLRIKRVPPVQSGADAGIAVFAPQRHQVVIGSRKPLGNITLAVRRASRGQHSEGRSEGCRVARPSSEMRAYSKTDPGRRAPAEQKPDLCHPSQHR